MARNPEHVPETIVGISFDDVFRAQEFLTAANRLAAHGDFKIIDAVIVRQGRRRQGPRARDHRSATRSLARCRARCGRACSGSSSAARSAGSPARRSAPARARSRPRSSTSASPTSGSRGSAKPCNPTPRRSCCSSPSSTATRSSPRPQRFTGAELVYANLDESTIDRHQGGARRHARRRDRVASPSPAPPARGLIVETLTEAIDRLRGRVPQRLLRRRRRAAALRAVRRGVRPRRSCTIDEIVRFEGDVGSRRREHPVRALRSVRPRRSLQRGVRPERDSRRRRRRRRPATAESRAELAPRRSTTRQVEGERSARCGGNSACIRSAWSPR